MIKKFIALFITLVLVLSFAACGNNTSDTPEPAPSSSENSAAGEKADVSLTDNEAAEIINGILSKAEKVFFEYTCGTAPFDDKKPADFNELYFLSNSPDYSTIAELKEYTEKYFTKECAERVFYKNCISTDEKNARFMEKDGKLYVNSGGKGWPYEYDVSTIKIKEQTADAFSVTVTRKMFDTVDGTSLMKLKKENGSWKFDNAFTEANAE